MSIDKAFILAAGHGKRLRPHTDRIPKPMVEVAGRTLLDRALDHLKGSGVRDVTLNTHYKAGILEDHLKTRDGFDFIISREPELLDTGGGIRKMIGRFGTGPFFVLSGDALWDDGPGGPALRRLAEAWDPARMDILLLLQPVSRMRLTRGVGDYHLQKDGRAVRARDQGGDYMFTSLRVNAPRIFDGAPENPFSYLDLMDRAEAQGRLYGLVHDGDWHHISTPDDLQAVEAALRNAVRKTA